VSPFEPKESLHLVPPFLKPRRRFAPHLSGGLSIDFEQSIPAVAKQGGAQRNYVVFFMIASSAILSKYDFESMSTMPCPEEYPAFRAGRYQSRDSCLEYDTALMKSTS